MRKMKTNGHQEEDRGEHDGAMPMISRYVALLSELVVVPAWRWCSVAIRIHLLG